MTAGSGLIHNEIPAEGVTVPEIAKPEAPLDAMSFVRQQPVRRLWLKELGLFASERRYSPATGCAGLADKSFSHFACSFRSAPNQRGRGPDHQSPALGFGASIGVIPARRSAIKALIRLDDSPNSRTP
jgi:hypothetical protein